jgi:hypothetical protein
MKKIIKMCVLTEILLLYFQPIRKYIYKVNEKVK